MRRNFIGNFVLQASRIFGFVFSNRKNNRKKQKPVEDNDYFKSLTLHWRKLIDCLFACSFDEMSFDSFFSIPSDKHVIRRWGTNAYYYEWIGPCAKHKRIDINSVFFLCKNSRYEFACVSVSSNVPFPSIIFYFVCIHSILIRNKF